jgi:uncharacterized protein (TIGR03435 family)
MDDRHPSRSAVVSLTVAFVASITAASIVSLQSQTAPAFEAASIKTNPAGSAPPIVRLTNGGRFQAPNSSLRDLIRVAYDLEDLQIVGGPGWMATDRFAVEATAGATATAAEALVMLRTLLADRFKLSARPEKRQAQGFILVTSGRERGRDLRPMGAECAPMKPPAGLPAPPPPPPPPGGPGAATPLGPDVRLRPTCGSMLMPGALSARGMTMEQLAIYLSRTLRRPVIDNTKLSGVFDIDLFFQPDVQVPPSLPIPADAPSMFAALQEQLGLKLESQRVPSDVLVIDRVERPTEN